jgi:hypothetical protein
MSTPSARRRPGGDAAPETCLVPGCADVSVRHLSLAEARRGFASLPEKGRRAPLCRTHYKEWKKATKESRVLDRLAW